MPRYRALPLLLAGLCLAARAGSAERPPAERDLVRSLAELRTVDKVAMLSSYDRTGGNDDGFSGRYSFVRKESDPARGEGLVIADLKGPGCVTRIWTPTPIDNPTEFYFDGEAQPRLTLGFRQLFDGTRPPFVQPLSGFGGGGFWTYLPLHYRQSLKVIVRAPRLQFYQLNYVTYAPGTEVRSFAPAAPDSPEAVRLRAALAAWSPTVGAVLSPPEGARTQRVAGKLAAGRPLTLLDQKRGGRVLGLRISPASALAGKDRGIVLRAFWDGDKEPAILSPAGDFFGFSWGEPAARSLLFGTEGDTCYAWFPMPFARSARVELVSERTGQPPMDVTAEVFTSPEPLRTDEGRFYALWRRENPCPRGKPFTFIETQGRGHLVAVCLQSQGPDSGYTPFFEGDDQATIDGELVAHGTGSEDFFNGGWYDMPGRWYSRLSFPLNGCLDYKKHLSRTGAYRLFLTDAYSFKKSLTLAIEHGPTGNSVVTDYCSVAYLYCDRRPTTPFTLAPPAGRAVVDIDRLVYSPGWNMPIPAFSIRRATLAKKNERLGGGDVQYLSVRAEGEDLFGPHFVVLTCEVPAAGRYRVSVEGIHGPDLGRVQLFLNERAVGSVADFYAEQRSRGRLQPLGTLDLPAGPAEIFLKVAGKDSRSTGIGLDLVTLLLERERQ